MIFWWFISVLMVSFEEINVLTALVWQTALCAHVHVLIHSIAPCRVPALLGNLSASLWTWGCSVSFPLRFEADERSVEEVVWGAVWLAHKLGPRLKTRAASLYQRPRLPGPHHIAFSWAQSGASRREIEMNPLLWQSWQLHKQREEEQQGGEMQNEGRLRAVKRPSQLQTESSK